MLQHGGSLETLCLGEGYHSQKVTYCMIPFVQKRSEQTNLQSQKIDDLLLSAGLGYREWGWEMTTDSSFGGSFEDDTKV